jgi:crotonobetainyl-CoA:carnitine CoA-transferase CaiB-like acyl-CoA transferase
VNVVTLALNLPGPGAVMRLAAMGARCTKVEPPAGDPMLLYRPHAYAVMHAGVNTVVADLKTEAGQRAVQRRLAKADVLITSFRPSALLKLGLGWTRLHAAHPGLCLVRIVGAPGVRAEEPGHDLTYVAENGLVTGLDLPPTLYADMGGALMASEATLQALLMRQAKSGQGQCLEVALSDAAAWLALPRSWGLTTPDGAVGGAHAGYQVYACADGRVAVAALEPHFAAALCAAAGLPGAGHRVMASPATREALAHFFATRTRASLEQLAAERDIPLHTLPKTIA